MAQKKVIYAFALMGFLSVVVEIIFPIHYHPYYWWHAFIGFDYIFGLLGGFVLIFVSKGLIYPLVKRSQDIYERSEED